MKNSSFVFVSLITSIFACSSVSSDPKKESNPSSSSPGSPAMVEPGDGGSSQSSDASTSDASSAPTLRSCIVDCEQKHPKAAAQSKQLDTTCFLAGECEPVCNDLKPGKLYSPTEVDGGGCNTVGADSYPITTTSQECSDCLNTAPSCCAQWIEIFASTEGRALNACTNECYTKFTK